jgi:ParG
VRIIKQPEQQVKRMNLNVPLELHNAFKSVTAGQGKNMTDVLLEFIQNYITKNSPKPKGRRR